MSVFEYHVEPPKECSEPQKMQWLLLIFESPSHPVPTTLTVMTTRSLDPSMDLGQTEVGLGRGRDKKRERPCNLNPDACAL